MDRLIVDSNRDKWPKHFNPCDRKNVDYIRPRNPHRFPPSAMAHNANSRYSLRPIRSKRGVSERKWPICPCGREINPIKQPALYPPRVFIQGEIDILGLQDMGEWSVVCIECDGLWVPRTNFNLPFPHEFQPRVPFKQALGLGGKGENHHTRKPWVNIPPDIINGEQEWHVHEIRDSRYYYRKVQYRVDWEGYMNGEVDDVWYPKENFENAQEKVREFHERHPNKPGPNNL